MNAFYLLVCVLFSLVIYIMLFKDFLKTRLIFYSAWQESFFFFFPSNTLEADLWLKWKKCRSFLCKLLHIGRDFFLVLYVVGFGGGVSNQRGQNYYPTE